MSTQGPSEIAEAIQKTREAAALKKGKSLNVLRNVLVREIDLIPKQAEQRKTEGKSKCHSQF